MTDDRAKLAEVRAYWEGLRSPGGLPDRAEIDPRGIAGALDSTFMAERIGPGLARFRIAGSRLAEIMATDPRGLPLSLLVVPEARVRLAALLERVFRGDPVEIGVAASLGLMRGVVQGRLLLLPLNDRSGQPDLCLGCLAVAAWPARGPRAFALGDEDPVPGEGPVAGYSPRPGHTPAPAFAPARPARPIFSPAAGAFAEPPAPPLVPPAAAGPGAAAGRRGRPYLRLVHSNDDK
jgi:hypothetical protein